MGKPLLTHTTKEDILNLQQSQLETMCWYLHRYWTISGSENNGYIAHVKATAPECNSSHCLSIDVKKL
jgi:hypothetical protein